MSLICIAWVDSLCQSSCSCYKWVNINTIKPTSAFSSSPVLFQSLSFLLSFEFFFVFLFLIRLFFLLPVFVFLFVVVIIIVILRSSSSSLDHCCIPVHLPGSLSRLSSSSLDVFLLHSGSYFCLASLGTWPKCLIIKLVECLPAGFRAAIEN